MTFDPEAVNLLIGIAGVLVWATIAFALVWIVLMTVGKVLVWLLTWPWLAWQGWHEGRGHRVTDRPWDWQVDGE